MISSKGRYALRVALDLAASPAGEYISLKDISERQNISRKYLEGIMTELTKRDIAESAIGKTGGYRLKRPPGELRVGEVLRAAEGELAPVACLSSESKKCGDGEVCVCHTLPFWKGLEERINEYIDSFTLADLLKSTSSGGCAGCGHVHGI